MVMIGGSLIRGVFASSPCHSHPQQSSTPHHLPRSNWPWQAPRRPEMHTNWALNMKLCKPHRVLLPKGYLDPWPQHPKKKLGVAISVNEASVGSSPSSSGNRRAKMPPSPPQRKRSLLGYYQILLDMAMFQCQNWGLREYKKQNQCE